MSVYSTAILAESTLVNYWQLNETSGTTATDSKGTYSLTYSGTFTLSQAGPNGVNDVAVAFDGSTAKAAGTATATLNGPYSVEAWIKTSSAAFTGGWFGTRSGGGNAEMRATATSIMAGLLGTSSSLVSLPSQTVTYADSKWHHIVFTVTSTVSQIWFDGVLIATDTHASNTMQLWANTIVINIGWGASTSEFWNGSICQVAVYNSVLNSGQIRSHYWLGAGVPPASLEAPTIPGSMTSLLARRRSALFNMSAGRYGLLVPTDTISNSVGTLGATKPTLITSPWGYALNFVNGTNQVTFGKASMPKSEGPWTLVFLGRINGPPVIIGGSRSGFISISTSGGSSIWFGYDNVAGNRLLLLKGTTAVLAGFYPRWGNWAFYAVTWDGKSIQNFYIYDWETGTFQYSSVSESTLSGQTIASDLAPSFGPVFGGTVGNFSLFDIVSFVIDRTAWTQNDFFQFVKDPFYTLRRPSGLLLNFSSSVKFRRNFTNKVGSRGVM